MGKFLTWIEGVFAWLSPLGGGLLGLVTGSAMVMIERYGNNAFGTIAVLAIFPFLIIGFLLFFRSWWPMFYQHIWGPFRRGGKFTRPMSGEEVLPKGTRAVLNFIMAWGVATVLLPMFVLG